MDLWEGRRSHRNLVAVYVLLVLFGVVPALALMRSAETRGNGAVWLALSLVIVGVGLWNIYNTHYRVTEQRVIRRLGILSRRVSTIELKDVRNVQTVQTVLDRLLDVGDVLISSAGQSDVEIEFSGVRNPSAVAGMIRDRRGEP